MSDRYDQVSIHGHLATKLQVYPEFRRILLFRRITSYPDFLIYPSSKTPDALSTHFRGIFRLF